MYNANKPDASELPSTGKLLKSTGIAVVIASALLVTVVLPAEYGVDPTRVGSLLGLTEMGRIKVQLAAEAEEAGTPYHGYGKGSEQRVEGELVAAFTGSHGWFWRNRTGESVTITLQTAGAYTEVKRVV